VSRDENAKIVFHHIFVKSESIYIKPKQKRLSADSTDTIHFTSTNV